MRSGGTAPDIWTEPDIEAGALQQLKNVASLPFIHPHGVAVMPDVHWGIGATVGSVIATRGAIIPAAVGVDIGCGMLAARSNLKLKDLPESLRSLRDRIETKVPIGKGGRQKDIVIALPDFPTRYFRGCTLEDGLGIKDIDGVAKQLGTLGGGNHFIELCEDEKQDVWIMLHSGSRGIGNQIGRHFIERAKLHMERYFINLPDQDLAYLPDGTEDHEDYCDAVEWAQEFAMLNRKAMFNLVIAAMKEELKRDILFSEEAVNCHHNYVQKEHHYGQDVWVTRKGAIRARSGDMGIIPGSMGAKSYIVLGKGNAASYNSCSHGAGRKYSRTEARERFTLQDLEDQTKGVECRKDTSVLDEIPAAYKNIEEVMAAQADLVEIKHTLKQILCVKGD